MPIGGEELLESGGENVCEVGLDIPANSTTLTVESPAMSWQKTASSPGRMSPSCVAFVSASTSVRVAPGCRTTGAVSSSFTSVGALSAGTTPRYTSCCLASASPSTVHLTVPPCTTGMESDRTGHCG